MSPNDFPLIFLVLPFMNGKHESVSVQFLTYMQERLKARSVMPQCVSSELLQCSLVSVSVLPPDEAGTGSDTPRGPRPYPLYDPPEGVAGGATSPVPPGMVAPPPHRYWAREGVREVYYRFQTYSCSPELFIYLYIKCVTRSLIFACNYPI